MHGHLFDKDKCDIADVINAAVDSVGLSNIKIPEKARLQAVKDLQSYPTGYSTDPLP